VRNRRLLPIGGVREKCLAAPAAGIRRTVLPQEDDRDLREVSQPVRDEIEFFFVDVIDQLLDATAVAKFV